MNSKQNLGTRVSIEMIQRKIILIRGHKVMIDKDLAILYGVETRYLNKAVRRNLKRFPEDFAFVLTKEEFQNLMFQFGTSSWGGSRKLPYVFTEQGIAMLSSVLNSDRAIAVNIQIMRIFTKIREMMLTHRDLAIKINELEKKYDKKFLEVFEAIRQLLRVKEEENKKKGPMGFYVGK